MAQFRRTSIFGLLAIFAGLVVGAQVATAQGSIEERGEEIQTVALECRTSANNDGCEKRVSCPSGTQIVAARAACNLEYGAITDAQLAEIPEGRLAVVRASDHVEEGSCWIEESRLIGDGRRSIEGVAGRSTVSIGCQEHDQNGGDCHLRGVLLCR